MVIYLVLEGNELRSVLERILSMEMNGLFYGIFVEMNGIGSSTILAAFIGRIYS